MIRDERWENIVATLQVKEDDRWGEYVEIWFWLQLGPNVYSNMHRVPEDIYNVCVYNAINITLDKMVDEMDNYIEEKAREAIREREMGTSEGVSSLRSE